ncbi:MAG: 3-isopropylmalate dehydrogenase [Porticoccaceae bacterium]
MKKILLLPGDHIGPEIVAEAVKVLKKVDRQFDLGLSFETGLLGGAGVDAVGEPCPQQTLDSARASDAILLGAVGGPEWDGIAHDIRPEKGLLKIRSELELFGNLRPAILYPQHGGCLLFEAGNCGRSGYFDCSRADRRGYFGEPRGIRTLENGEREGYNTYKYSESEIRRIGKVAFEAAMVRNKRVCSVDKANVLEATVLWREVMEEVAKDYPEVQLSHMYVDNAAMQLVRAPKQFDVVVTGNMFGDILSDAAAMLTGSIGMLPSASLDKDGKGLYEPCHGSAPDISGQGIANPLATILSAAMMLRYSLSEAKAADAIEQAVSRVLDNGLRTSDIYTEGTRKVGTVEMGDAVVAAL